MQNFNAGVLITAHAEGISKARPKHINLLTAADRYKQKAPLKLNNKNRR